MFFSFVAQLHALKGPDLVGAFYITRESFQGNCRSGIWRSNSAPNPFPLQGSLSYPLLRLRAQICIRNWDKCAALASSAASGDVECQRVPLPWVRVRVGEPAERAFLVLSLSCRLPPSWGRVSLAVKVPLSSVLRQPVLISCRAMQDVAKDKIFGYAETVSARVFNLQGGLS